MKQFKRKPTPSFTHCSDKFDVIIYWKTCSYFRVYFMEHKNTQLAWMLGDGNANSRTNGLCTCSLNWPSQVNFKVVELIA